MSHTLMLHLGSGPWSVGATLEGRGLVCLAHRCILGAQREPDTQEALLSCRRLDEALKFWFPGVLSSQEGRNYLRLKSWASLLHGMVESMQALEPADHNLDTFTF